MRPGICLAAFGDRTLPEAVAAVRALGIEVIDLPTDSTMHLLQLGRDIQAIADVVHRALKDSGLKIGCVSNSRDTQRFLGPAGVRTQLHHPWATKPDRNAAFSAAIATIDLAAELGCGWARLHFGCPDFSRWLTWNGMDDTSWSDNVTLFVEATQPILQHAYDRGVMVLLEPHPKQVLYDPMSTRAVLRALPDSAPVKLCLDVANVAALGFSSVSLTRGWGEALAAVHVKDLQTWPEASAPVGAGWCRYGPGPAIRFRALGTGDLPWAQILDALVDEGFDGIIYLENEDATRPRATALRDSAARLRQLVPTQRPEGRTW